MPGDLVYLALIESGFANTAVSRARATGMWQFMKATGRGYGLRVDSWVDDRRDPWKATVAAARHLKDLQQRFGSLYLAAAAYNAGAGKVSRGLKRIGPAAETPEEVAEEEQVPEDAVAVGTEEEEEDGPSDADFFRLYDTRHLRRETKDYVPKLIAAALISKHPELFGFETLAMMEPLKWDVAEIPDATDLTVIARCAGVSVEQIKELNPELRRWTTPIRATEYELKVPMGTASVINARLTEQGLDDLAPLSHYTVKKGETLASIAKKLRVSRSDLAEANYLSSKSRLRTGQQLIIPRAPTLLAARTEPDASPSADVVLASRTSQSTAAEEPAARSTKTHRVARGETLFSIAKRYGTTVALIKELNDLRGNVIRVGQRLVIEPLSNLATN